MNDIHRMNRRYWEQSAPGWRALRERDGLWRRCPKEPRLAFEGKALEHIMDFAGSLAGKEICVLGSGDNYAAFALAGLGARVTSTDIARAQLDVAEVRARELGLDIRFLQADATDLAQLDDKIFDLVVSTNGFFVWIAEPAAVCAEAFRVLRPGGAYVFYDVHPFQRPWRRQAESLEAEKRYWDTGPFAYDGPNPSREFNWTMADLLNPLAESGLRLRRIEESPSRDANYWEGASNEPGSDARLLDWRHNPRAALPAWLTVVAEKPTGGAYVQERPAVGRTRRGAPPSQPSSHIRNLVAADCITLSAAFAAQGWVKPTSQFERYLEESERGERSVLVAERQGRPAGYATIVWTSNYGPFAQTGIPEIVDFNVLIADRRLGIGTALMDAAEAMAFERGDAVGLGVGLTADYGAAQRMYAKRGYVPDGRGLMWQGQHPTFGEQVDIDDSLVLHLVKRGENTRA